MTRFAALAIAALMVVAPTVAFAADPAPAAPSTDSSMAAPKKAHKHHSKKKADAAAPAADSTAK
jgi:hypothetical protein